MIAYLRLHAERTGTPYDVRGWDHGMDAYLYQSEHRSDIPYPRDPRAGHEYVPVVAGMIGNQLVVHRTLACDGWWSVSDAVSGCRIASGPSRREAVSVARMCLREKCRLSIRTMRGLLPELVDAVSIDGLLEASRRAAETEDRDL